MSGLGADRLVALVARNVDGPDAVPRAALVEHLDALADRPVPERVAAWAQLFLERGEADYRFGDASGGYVTDGLLVNDRHTDCVLLCQRAVELAHADSPESALLEALERRFPGASLDEVVGPDGRVDYMHPARLAFAWDLARSGVLGEDVTETVAPLTRDPGTARYASGVVAYARSAEVDESELRNGDIVYFVLDETHAGADRIRQDVGAVIGHMGFVQRAPYGSRIPMLVHAASTRLLGFYEGGRIVSVSLRTYLDRVERFKGIVVTRLGDEPD